MLSDNREFLFTLDMSVIQGYSFVWPFYKAFHSSFLSGILSWHLTDMPCCDVPVSINHVKKRRIL